MAIKRDLDTLPDEPGIYIMKDDAGQVLYVGKAKNIKVRVRQYFAASSSDERVQVPYLVAQVAHIETIVVHSEREALMLESNFIKRYKPKYNILLKDDKSYFSLTITHSKWPKVELVRYRNALKGKGSYFGPYTSAKKAREMFDLVGKLFPLRTCRDEEFARRTRPCMLYQIKRCSAPCVGYISEKEYGNIVQDVEKLLEGDTKEIIRRLEDKMNECSEKLEFERAQYYLERIQLLKNISEKQHVDMIWDHNFDVWGTYRKGLDLILSKLMWRQGKLLDIYHYDFDRAVVDTGELITSFLVQHYQAEPLNTIPDSILLADAVDNIEVLSELISQIKDKRVEVTIPQRGNKVSLCSLAKKNAESFFEQKKDQSAILEQALLDLQEQLGLRNYPERIECFDNSHFSGSELVSAMVVFVHGQKFKNGYRKYTSKTVVKPDDYALMKEVLKRRYIRAQEEGILPDLIVVDGGKGHFNAAKEVLEDLNIIGPELVSIVKEEGRHDKGQTQERFFTENKEEAISLPLNSRALFLIQNIRDEAHRFAITFMTKRRSKSTIKSALDSIPGIGPKKKKALIKHFGSPAAIREKSITEIMQVSGISQANARDIFSFFHKDGG